MNTINLVSLQNLSFNAKVKINASDRMISRATKAYYESLGPKIGAPDDIIEITMSDLYPSNSNKSTMLYRCTQYNEWSKNGERYSEISHVDVPYIKNDKVIPNRDPLAYLTKIFQRNFGV